MRYWCGKLRPRIGERLDLDLPGFQELGEPPGSRPLPLPVARNSGQGTASRFSFSSMSPGKYPMSRTSGMTGRLTKSRV